jgi:hypothetical protein
MKSTQSAFPASAIGRERAIDMKVMSTFVAIGLTAVLSQSPALAGQKKYHARSGPVICDSNDYCYDRVTRVVIHAPPSLEPVFNINPFAFKKLPPGVTADDRRNRFKGTDPDRRVRTEIQRDFSFFDR